MIALVDGHAAGNDEEEEQHFPFFGYPKIGDSGGWAKIPKTTKPWIVLEKIHGLQASLRVFPSLLCSHVFLIRSCFTIATNGITLSRQPSDANGCNKAMTRTMTRAEAACAVLKKSVLLHARAAVRRIESLTARDTFSTCLESCMVAREKMRFRAEIFYCPEVSFRCFDAAVDGVFVDYCNGGGSMRQGGHALLETALFGPSQQMLGVQS